jgi:hypothetical protein
MNDEYAQIAWAAGLFEGEGTIVDSAGPVQLRVKMTDLDVLERLLDIWGGRNLRTLRIWISRRARAQAPLGLDLR